MHKVEGAVLDGLGLLVLRLPRLFVGWEMSSTGPTEFALFALRFLTLSSCFTCSFMTGSCFIAHAPRFDAVLRFSVLCPLMLRLWRTILRSFLAHWSHLDLTVQACYGFQSMSYPKPVGFPNT